MPQDKLNILETAIMAGFSGVAGALSYTMRTLNRDEKPKLLNLFVECLSSAFVGVLAMLLCRQFELSIYWTGVIVGVFGWVGAQASMVVLARLVRQRLGVDDVNGKSS